MKVLIFGINSFTGQHLRRYLDEKDIEIFGTSNQPIITSSNILQCDISDIKQVESVLNQIQPDYIINLAGISFVAHEDIFEFYKINALAVDTLLKACLNSQKRPEKIILASSSTVYGNQNVKELSEDLIPKPQNHYGLSKLMMENIAQWYEGKLNIIITRPFNYTGPGQNNNFLIPKIVDHFKRKAAVIELGNLHVYREFNDVEFVCDVYYELFISKINNGIFNICTGTAYCIDDVLTAMTQLTGHQIEIKVNPAFVRKDEIEFLVGSNYKLKKIFRKNFHYPINGMLIQMLNCLT